MLEILNKLFAVNLCRSLSQTRKNVFIYFIAIILLWNVWITWPPLSSLFHDFGIVFAHYGGYQLQIVAVSFMSNHRLECARVCVRVLAEHKTLCVGTRCGTNPRGVQHWWCPSAYYSSLFLMNMLSQERESSCLLLVLLIYCTTAVDMKMWARWI